MPDRGTSEKGSTGREKRGEPRATNDGTWVDPATGKTWAGSVAPPAGYVYVPYGKAIQHTDLEGNYSIVDSPRRRTSREGPSEPGPTFLPYKMKPQVADEFDALLRSTALGKLQQQQRGGRQSTFFTGPRGVQGPLKTVLG